MLYAVGAAITWGVVYTIDQHILKGIPAVELLVVNAIVTAVVTAPLLLFRRIGPTLDSIPPATWALMIASVFLAAVANLLIFSSIKRLGASTASVFEIAYPLFVVLFSYGFLKVKPSSSFLVGAVLVLAGSAIIIATGS
jgi:drug/metabolite transporter (DMT)-like permease